MICKKMVAAIVPTYSQFLSKRSNNVVKIRGKRAALPARPLAGAFATRIQLFSFVRTRNEENEQKMKTSKNGKSPQKPQDPAKGNNFAPDELAPHIEIDASGFMVLTEYLVCSPAEN